MGETSLNIIIGMTYVLNCFHLLYSSINSNDDCWWNALGVVLYALDASCVSYIKHSLCKAISLECKLHKNNFNGIVSSLNVQPRAPKVNDTKIFGPLSSGCYRKKSSGCYRQKIYDAFMTIFVFADVVDDLYDDICWWLVKTIYQSIRHFRVCTAIYGSGRHGTQLLPR